MWSTHYIMYSVRIQCVCETLKVLAPRQKLKPQGCNKNAHVVNQCRMPDAKLRLLKLTRKVIETMKLKMFGHVRVMDYRLVKNTRKLCYRKDDRAMRPTYGCPKNFWDSLTTSTGTIPNIFMGFSSGRPYECSYKI